jgi:hypothetical protein
MHIVRVKNRECFRLRADKREIDLQKQEYREQQGAINFRGFHDQSTVGEEQY